MLILNKWILFAFLLGAYFSLWHERHRVVELLLSCVILLTMFRCRTSQNSISCSYFDFVLSIETSSFSGQRRLFSFHYLRRLYCRKLVHMISIPFHFLRSRLLKRSHLIDLSFWCLSSFGSSRRTQAKLGFHLIMRLPMHLVLKLLHFHKFTIKHLQVERGSFWFVQHLWELLFHLFNFSYRKYIQN